MVANTNTNAMPYAGDATRTERVEGAITHINARGFGFIQPNNNECTVFFHASAVAGGRYDDL